LSIVSSLFFELILGIRIGCFLEIQSSVKSVQFVGDFGFLLDGFDLSGVFEDFVFKFHEFILFGFLNFLRTGLRN